ncbi:MAG: S-formylglutathione hydrolase [Pseudomonadota bacterium]
MTLTTHQSWMSFGGTLSVHDHDSAVCGCAMRFAVYSPPQAVSGAVPVVWYLSGLTCNWSNVMEKSGLQKTASDLGVMVVAPDTSPRGEAVADDDAYDLGQGAGFYLSATEEPWAKHYAMDRYITEELQDLVLANFPADGQRQGIMGHSMGGHGALTLHLKNPSLYASVSAFSPIVAPSQVPWGEKAFTSYLGQDRARWLNYDATHLVQTQPSEAEILIDQGDKDSFLEQQLRPALFEEACAKAGQPLTFRMQPGYDHSYYFIASFISDHLRHHHRLLTTP